MHPFPGNAVCSRPGARFHFEANLTRATSYLPFLAKPSDNNDGDCIPSFHSPATPQSGLCVVFLCCHHSVAQLGTTRGEAQEAERSALVVAQLVELCVFIRGSAEFSETPSWEWGERTAGAASRRPP